MVGIGLHFFKFTNFLFFVFSYNFMFQMMLVPSWKFNICIYMHFFKSYVKFTLIINMDSLILFSIKILGDVVLFV